MLLFHLWAAQANLELIRPDYRAARHHLGRALLSTYPGSHDAREIMAAIAAIEARL